MFFGQGKNAKVMNDDDLRKTVQIILDYKSYCDSLGIRFMYVQTPNKETIYFEQVALQSQPNFLIRLQKEMEKLNVNGINTLSIFNNFKSKNRAMLYHFDDTHWNSIGIDLVSTAISREIEKGKSLKTSIR